MMKFNIFRTELCLGDVGHAHCRGQNMRFIFHQLPHRTETKLQSFRCVLQNANLPQLMTAVETETRCLHFILFYISTGFQAEMNYKFSSYLF